MSSRPYPQAFEQAFQFGEAVVRLYYHAEHRWFHVPDIDPPVPVAVEMWCGRLRDLVGRLQRLIPSRARPRLCNRLTDQLDTAWQEYCSCWQSPTHREAIIAISNDDPERGFDIAQDLLNQSPVLSAAWRTLRQYLNDFVDALPRILGDLERLGELTAKGLWWSAADPDASQVRSNSFQQYLTITLNGRLRQKLRDIQRRLPALRGIACDLFGLDMRDAISQLEAIQLQVLAAIQQHAADLENPPERDTSQASERDQRSPRRSIELAWQSYNYAVSMMHPSDLSARGTDDAVWTWLNESPLAATVLPSYRLPSFETWSRYLRLAREHYIQDRDPRLAQRTGRSTRRPDEVFSGRRD